jgi:hypothetical protein
MQGARNSQRPFIRWHLCKRLLDAAALIRTQFSGDQAVQQIVPGLFEGICERIIAEVFLVDFRSLLGRQFSQEILWQQLSEVGAAIQARPLFSSEISWQNIMHIF